MSEPVEIECPMCDDLAQRVALLVGEVLVELSKLTDRRARETATNVVLDTLDAVGLQYVAGAQ